MSSTTIDGRGVIVNGGSGLLVGQDAGNSGFGPYALPVTALTSDTTLVIPGVYTLSSSTGAATAHGIVVTMPLASSVPGAQFIFKAVSAHVHGLTGSQETGGTKVFCQNGAMSGTLITGSAQGSRLELRNVFGSSVSLVSDGTSFLVSTASGSIGLFAP